MDLLSTMCWRRFTNILSSISNTEGQLYSLYMRHAHFRWIHDSSSIDKFMTLVPGNNGLLYVIFPAQASVIAVDVYTGNVIWKQSSGPLSREESLPVVDSNGDVKKLLEAIASDSVIQASPVPDCSGFAVYISQLMMEAKSTHVIGNYTYISAMKPASIVFTMLAPATGTVYWTGKYPGQKNAWTCSQTKREFICMYTGNERAILLFLFFQLAILVLLACCVRYCFIFWRKKKLQDGLVRFLEKRRSLHHRRTALGRMISELEQKAAEDTSNHEALEQLGEMVKAKEGIERKLASSYSLGRDSMASRQGSMLPQYGGNSKGH